MKPRTTACLMIPFWVAVIILGPSLHSQHDVHASAAAMRARYETIQGQLGENQFKQPIYLNSSRNDNQISGELSGVIEYPFEIVEKSFKSANHWCDIMGLHLNVKYCRASENGRDHILTMFFGRKFHEPLASAYRGEYVYRVLIETEDYFKVGLTSDEGPFRTRNYQIVLEAIPMAHGRTFIHLAYAYEFGFMAKTAKSLYFSTAGSKKVGFTVIDRGPNGHPIHIGGVLGAVERNVMRYYLALTAYLGAQSVPPPERLDKRLNDWFASTEQYPLQLHEVEQSEYLQMKRLEYARQQAIKY